MGSPEEADNLKTELLANLSLDETAEFVARIVQDQVSTSNVGVLLWDPDLESFGEQFVFGPGKKELTKLVEAFCAVGESPSELISELDAAEYKVKLPEHLEPLLCYRLAHDNSLVALLIIAGSDDDAAEVAEKLNRFKLAIALYNSWQHSELERENKRLRNQYEDMENKLVMLEEQTRKLIHDITKSNSVRTRQVERDRLVYSISNMVRSSLNIQRVLETAAEQIGTTFGTSRCLILRYVDSADQINVFEFTQPPIEPAKQLFFTEEGLRFASQALMRSNPHEIDDVENTKSGYGYDPAFLKLLNIRSGLLVPLVLRDNILGVMFLQHCEDNREWSIDDVSLIGSLGDQMSVAIENAELHQERERQAVTDGLTGISNRRSFNETFSREFERARRYGEPLSLVVIDLDHLKKLNDTFGHQVGDEAIKAIGRLLRQSSRSVDMPARYGGEEFCLLLPNTEIDMAEQLADRLRRLINDVELGAAGRISASIGVASYPLHAEEPDDLFKRADEALYVAKQTGRNRVCVGKPMDPKDRKPVESDAAANLESNVVMQTEPKSNAVNDVASDGTTSPSKSSKLLT